MNTRKRISLNLRWSVIIKSHNICKCIVWQCWFFFLFNSDGAFSGKREITIFELWKLPITMHYILSIKRTDGSKGQINKDNNNSSMSKSQKSSKKIQIKFTNKTWENCIRNRVSPISFADCRAVFNTCLF